MLLNYAASLTNFLTDKKKCKYESKLINSMAQNVLHHGTGYKRFVPAIWLS